MKILINLIGGQPAPVYIATRIINPDKVLLVYSKDSELQVSRLKNTLPAYNYDSLEVSPYDMEDCYQKLLTKLQDYSSDELIMNLTSGTKIMSFAAFKIFDESHLEMIYVDSQNHCLIKIDKSKKIISTPLKLIFSIQDYFSLYGYNIEMGNVRFPDNDTYRKLNSVCSKYYIQLKNIVTAINRQLEEKKTLLEAKDNSGQCYFRYNFKKLKGILKITQGRNLIEIEIESTEMISYLTGYWFEDYVYNKLFSTGKFDQILKNIKLYLIRENLKPEYQNEFDIVAIKDQTLYIFECKTGNLDKVIAEKLRLIKSISGTYSKIYLITLFKPLESASLNRIMDFNINLITFDRLDNFISSLISTSDSNPSL